MGLSQYLKRPQAQAPWKEKQQNQRIKQEERTVVLELQKEKRMLQRELAATQPQARQDHEALQGAVTRPWHVKGPLQAYRKRASHSKRK